ncbi:hypothetical protein VTJ04DRAFT_3680 [Mycothermus thermophilus]|uniref:uncharacterized protein n=1 Tax=Humicola insolens TaxID=85995 RepID=UPI003743B935
MNQLRSPRGKNSVARKCRVVEHEYGMADAHPIPRRFGFSSGLASAVEFEWTCKTVLVLSAQQTELATISRNIKTTHSERRQSVSTINKHTHPFRLGHTEERSSATAVE